MPSVLLKIVIFFSHSGPGHVGGGIAGADTLALRARPVAVAPGQGVHIGCGALTSALTSGLAIKKPVRLARPASKKKNAAILKRMGLVANAQLDLAIRIPPFISLAIIGTRHRGARERNSVSRGEGGFIAAFLLFCFLFMGELVLAIVLGVGGDKGSGGQAFKSAESNYAPSCCQ